MSLKWSLEQREKVLKFKEKYLKNLHKNFFEASKSAFTDDHRTTYCSHSYWSMFVLIAISSMKDERRLKEC